MSFSFSPSILVKCALQANNFGNFIKHASNAINLMLDKDWYNFTSEIYELTNADNSKIFCDIATNLKNKLKNHTTNSSKIEWQLDSLISHAERKFPIKQTTSNDKKQNIQNLQFNQQPQKPPKISDHLQKQNFKKSPLQSPKQENLKLVQQSNFQSDVQNIQIKKSPLNDQQLNYLPFRENEKFKLQPHFHPNQTLNEQVFSELDDFNISYSFGFKNDILLKIVQLFKKIISSNFPEQSKTQCKIQFSKFEEMINNQINGRKELFVQFKNILQHYFGNETGTEEEIISKYNI
jgi:hypothetical protein